ncbi:hypothetical protein OG760_37235 (plasmid) [Streptomyces sp. NBC_00963]|uniref:hypothetical protein n=1 Tax=Streptomyces sp. NBC_00963 TaxID=2903697 RepID=UPI00386EE937|nr:hypothetical protein OG760_37235 [Streptomyces sp. NBC_00963]
MISSASLPDRPCVLPSFPSWISDVQWLDLVLLDQLAGAAGDTIKDGPPLPDAPYQTAADAINNLAADLDEPPATVQDSVYLKAVPAWEVDALWQVLLVLREAQADTPGTTGLRELLEEIGTYSSPTRSPKEAIASLERVLAVLLLDIPAVRTLATALILKTPWNSAAAAAAAQIHRAWSSAGIHPGPAAGT